MENNLETIKEVIELYSNKKETLEAEDVSLRELLNLAVLGDRLVEDHLDDEVNEDDTDFTE